MKDYINHPIQLEPIHSNRFYLIFPKEFELEPYCVKKMSEIKFDFKSGWKDIVISIQDVIGLEITKRISENVVGGQQGTFILEKLDPTGVCIEKIKINSKLIYINYGDFNYSSDKLNVIKIKIRPISIIIE